MPVDGDAKARAKAEKAAKAVELKAQKEAAKAEAKAEAEKAAADLKAQKEAAKQAAAQKAADEAAAKATAKADAAKAAADLKAQKAAAKKAAEQKAAEVAAAKKQVKASMESPKPVEVTSVPAAVNVDNPAQAKAREALAQTLFDSAAQAPAIPAGPVTPVAKPEPMPQPAPAMTPAPAPKTVIAPAPIGMAPPLPITMEKQQKLQELLAKYRADQVTPEEYQKQRAAILAEP